MGPAPARGNSGVPALSQQRALVLEALQGRDGPVTAAGLAGLLGLHVNTAREHLDALVERGLAVRGQAPAAGRGRPAWTYAVAAEREPDPRVREYAGLVAALAGHLRRTSPDPVAGALDAGQAWGADLMAGTPPAGSAIAARRQVVELLERMGFQPQADARAVHVALQRCPLLDAAVRDPELICSVHLGLARGALQALGADARLTELRPFAEPGACHLALHTPPASNTNPDPTPKAIPNPKAIPEPSPNPLPRASRPRRRRVNS